MHLWWFLCQFWSLIVTDQSEYPAKRLLLCFTEESKSYGFGRTWWWVNELFLQFETLADLHWLSVSHECVCVCVGCWLTRIFSLNFSPVILQLILWYFCETEVCVCFTFACIISSMSSLQTLSFLASLFVTLSVKCCLDFSKCRSSHSVNQVLWYGK